MSRSPIKLSDHFSYPKLLRFTLPSIAMMIVTSIYGVVDGLFVSNFVGATPFAALNLIMPFMMIFGAVGFMLGSGGSAYVARTLGEGDAPHANRIFSLLIAVLVGCGIVSTVLGELFLRPVAVALGATPELLPYCVEYGRVLLLALVPFMLQNTFQAFFVVAEKPHMGLGMSLAAGICNIILDFLFLGVFGWGLSGAAAATGISQAVGGVIPLVYFLRKNSSVLRLVRPKWDGHILLLSCINGSSEMMTNLSMSLVNMLYNLQLMRLAGANGVAAFGIIMYVSFIFVASFIGYSMGAAPLISFHHGAENHGELKNLFRKSLLLLLVAALLMTGAAEVLAAPLASIFVGYDPALQALSTRALRLFSLHFLLAWFNIYASSLFTALGNGALSALISFLRTLVMESAMVFLLPLFLGIDGVWLAMTGAEILTAVVSLFLLLSQKRRYHYL